MNERKAFSLPGIILALTFIVLSLGCLAWIIGTAEGVESGAAALPNIIIPVVVLVVLGLCTNGFFQVQPNQGRVLQLFGRYAGTAREEGLRWTNPFYSKQAISLRVRNFESSKLKVNDADGNPIEIAAIVVWQVVDTAEAVFCVDDYENYVQIQSESALRQMAQSYPYDAHEAGKPALRSHGDQVNSHLANEIQQRLGKAGVTVTEARISHLAYAQEIAQAMLQRQQASAIVAARERIVDVAVSMVERALAELGKRGVVDLDNERRAAMVSNLLVVLCGERATQPVVNTGTLYSG
ncbi:MAG: SPFH domain-containing protein [Rhodanobacteraceae bacterium]|nr:SPFH domain-containing protein [Rhodanobacteraceae bacterium]